MHVKTSTARQRQRHRQRSTVEEEEEERNKKIISLPKKNTQKNTREILMKRLSLTLQKHTHFNLNRCRLFATTGSTSNEGFLQAAASPYVEGMYDAWRQDPQSVHVSWRIYFEQVNDYLMFF